MDYLGKSKVKLSAVVLHYDESACDDCVVDGILLALLMNSFNRRLIGVRNVPNHSSFVILEKYEGKVKDKSFSISSTCCNKFVALETIAWLWIGETLLFSICQSLSHVFKSVWLKNSWHKTSTGPVGYLNIWAFVRK